MSKVVAFMRDSVASNSVALRGLLGTFSAAADILCLPHTLNDVGEHFNLSTLPTRSARCPRRRPWERW
jgi:hypothetical protein